MKHLIEALQAYVRAEAKQQADIVAGDYEGPDARAELAELEAALRNVLGAR